MDVIEIDNKRQAKVTVPTTISLEVRCVFRIIFPVSSLILIYQETVYNLCYIAM